MKISKLTLLIVVALFLLTIPTWVRMLPSGLFSMQDFPYFRLVEYSKCLKDAQVPCRWAPDAGLGYGEPVFNFYSHTPFLIGAILIKFGLSAVSSLKIVFALSYVLSAYTMFLLSRKVWKNFWSALLSTSVYLYAPYRAIDVWVRAALPESFAFIFLPLILYTFEKYVESKKGQWLVLFSLSIALLIITHNLSVVLFSFIIFIWIIVRLIQEKKLKLFIPLIISGIGSLLITSFYLLPSILESKYVDLISTTQGYFDFRAHFVTFPQIFLSRYWGYGGSTWGAEDGLSLAVGQIQWILGVCVIVLIAHLFIKTKKINKQASLAFVLVISGFIYLFLMHNKSAFLWEYLSALFKYIQFPWRFLGASVFSFALAAGFIPLVFGKYKRFISVTGIVIVVLFNISYFREDIWLPLTDADLQSGDTWIEQTRASISDYWPLYGPISHDFASLPTQATLLNSNSYSYTFSLKSEGKPIELPINYFKGWTADAPFDVNDNGKIEVKLLKGERIVHLSFNNTPIRTIGNTISVVSGIVMLCLFIYYAKPYNKNSK